MTFIPTIALLPQVLQPLPAYTIPIVDISAETRRQVVVDREPGQYLGHPTTVLLEDGKTMIAVYPKGHGRGAIVMKRSTDGGKSWSGRLPTPASWETSLETPTIHRTIDPAGKKHLILFSGLHPIRMAHSEDDGKTWSELEPIGDFGGVVAMASVERLKNGDYMALFHDDGRFLRRDGKAANPPVFVVYKTISHDGGLTWSQPEAIARHPQAHLCEPGLIRSPDGKRIAVLLRENSRKFNSFVIFSDDEGQTWTEPHELPAALTGDRHVGKYARDGRLFVTFRDTTRESKTKGDWVGWVGSFEDIEKGREGQYRVRIMDNHKAADCAYPGLELLPDGTFATTTYGHWTEGEQPYIVSVRFKLTDLDRRSVILSRAKNPDSRQKPKTWQVGEPIVTYWAGPPMTDAAAQQLADGGWNLVWCTEKELKVAQRHGLRAQLTDGLLAPETLDDPARKAQLDALIDRVKSHPALYCYFITDEPASSRFPALGKLVAYLKERDPAHLAYINLFPTYATNEQLGNKGDTVTAYKEHLRQFIDVVKPALLSYDHYQFATGRDMPDYFLNLALVRQAALDAGLPFLNIVQAATWTPSMREPNENEMRYLVYTTAAYGAQGISYYVYAAGGHTPGIATLDGKPTHVYGWLQKLHPEFTAIVKELQPLRSTGVYHAGMLPPGAVALPADLPFQFDPPLPQIDFKPGERTRGVLIGCFGKPGKGPVRPTHAVVVNLDYKDAARYTLKAARGLEIFDPLKKKWSRSGKTVTLDLPPGGGKLLRIGR